MGTRLTALLTVIFLSFPAFADNMVATVEGIDDVVGRLDEAFAEQDAETIKSLMTPDHVAVLPYRAGPQSLDDLVETLPELKLKQTDLSEPSVVMLGPDHAMRTLTAKFKGSFAGKPIDSKVFITSIMVKKDGKWLESFYQVTTLAP